MRLTEIKPGMVITCTHREEVIELWDYLNKNYGTPNDDEYGIDEMLKCYMEGYHFKINGDEWEEVTDGGIPYAALLLPELSAEEVWNGLGDIDDNELFAYFQADQSELQRAELICMAEWWELADLVEKHKADHEKKEPEIEWVYRVEIEETKQYSDWITEELAIKQCENLAKETGENVAYRKVCRVKAVE